uniref:tRNA (adenine(58)-N(1))-methyltransferase, mitochondrial n=1 Tax=Danio rerio TaxID=7955 RepID=UPI0000F20254
MTPPFSLVLSFMPRKFARVSGHNVFRVKPSVCGLRSCSTDSKDTDRDVSEAAPAPASQFSRRVLGRRRPLSPLERVSQLLPQDSLSPEVWGLRDTRTTEEEPSSPSLEKEREEETHHHHHHHVCVPGERLMCFGETLMAEFRRARDVEFRKMFELKERQKLYSNWGSVAHDDMEGRPAGSVIRTSKGIPFVIRRVSLEEFVLFMKRGPAIAYPKDASAMLTMMDVTKGDCVLECGSGSGGMSLFLSRAVGYKGSVLSVEIREDHHKRSVLNYQRWLNTWRRRRGQEWPDNVHFHHGDIISAGPLLAGRGLNSVALDMINPHLALPVVVPYLHPGSVCAVYQANITQVIDLLEALRCSALPLVCECITEVQHRDWLVVPSLKKDGTFNKRKAPYENSDQDEPSLKTEEVLNSQDAVPFGDVQYIARPHPEQVGHTAFLVKLRKILK